MNVGDWYEEHSEGLRRYAISLSRSLDRADDLIQETFMHAVMHSATLQQMNRFQRDAWLKRVLRNKFLDEQRSAKRKRQMTKLLISDHQRQPQGADLPDFEALLDLVPIEHQEIFEKRYQLGMNSAEIGASLDLPAGTIRYRLHQCIHCLRASLEQDIKGVLHE